MCLTFGDDGQNGHHGGGGDVENDGDHNDEQGQTRQQDFPCKKFWKECVKLDIVNNKFLLISVCPPLRMISGFSAGHKKCFVVKSRVAKTRSYLVGNGSTSATLSIIKHQITTIVNMQN